MGSIMIVGQVVLATIMITGLLIGGVGNEGISLWLAGPAVGFATAFVAMILLNLYSEAFEDIKKPDAWRLPMVAFGVSIINLILGYFFWDQLPTIGIVCWGVMALALIGPLAICISSMGFSGILDGVSNTFRKAVEKLEGIFPDKSKDF